MALELAEVRAIVPLCLTGWLAGWSALVLCSSAHKEINIHITYLLNVRVQSVFRPLSEWEETIYSYKFSLLSSPRLQLSMSPTIHPRNVYPNNWSAVASCVQYVPSTSSPSSSSTLLVTLSSVFDFGLPAENILGTIWTFLASCSGSSLWPQMYFRT